MWQSWLSVVMLCISSFVKILTMFSCLCEDEVYHHFLFVLLLYPFHLICICFGGDILSVGVSIYTLHLLFNFGVNACRADSSLKSLLSVSPLSCFLQNLKIQDCVLTGSYSETGGSSVLLRTILC